MDATTLSITLSAILAVICIPCGLFLGLVPMKADTVTAKQSKASQMVSFIVAIVFIGLLVAGHDAETRAMVIGLVIGFAVAKIPALHARALHKWPFFEPKKMAPTPKRVKKARRSKLWPYLFAESGISTSVSRFFIGRAYPLRHIAESYCRNTPQVGRPLSRTRHPDTKVPIAHPSPLRPRSKKKPGERPGLKGEERKKIHQIMLR